MCIFSGNVISVSDTNIFARLSGRGTQFLVYSMKYSSERPVAMILPLPVADPAKRLGIRFINFKAYGDFFNDLENGFPRPAMVQSAAMAGAGGGAPMARPTIHVESVGDFIASYVPTLDDFDRIDRRFRLPRSVWAKIPKYADYGFAVFQLKDTAAKRAASVSGNGGGLVANRRPSLRDFGTGIGPSENVLKVHPMAFEFHTRYPDMLYYPTVHIHDEQVHASEEFDHSLFFQDPHVRQGGRGAKMSGPVSTDGVSGRIGGMRNVIQTSSGPASGFVELPKTQGAVDGRQACFKLELRGDYSNRDTLIRVG